MNLFYPPKPREIRKPDDEMQPVSMARVLLYLAPNRKGLVV